ncbi:MAG: formate dehydrogenase accessory sulfurtransferase FdhD [Deltaproteobacteria bacterium]|jgi:FdhD protein|nr:formate dehydrogenase accessory sulfurtransferase FdhD [Deltaproteobacteria bacterium]
MTILKGATSRLDGATPNAAPSLFQVRRLCAGEWQNIIEEAAPEASLRILYEGGESRLWASPHEAADLAAGHVLLDCLHDAAPDCPSSRGIPPAEAREQDGAWRVTLLPQSALSRTEAKSFGSLRPEDLVERMAEFLNAVALGACAGSRHRAALFHAAAGRFACVAEDLGRHNCLDRLAGHIALSGGSARTDPAEHVLFVTARVTAGLYCKARRLGARCLVGRTAVGSAAVEMARKQGVGLIGFCRPEEERFTVYNDPLGWFAA